MEPLSPKTTKFSSLSNKFNDKILDIPSFQREYVWKEQQGRELLDSIYKGYPTGLIYVWKPKDGKKVSTKNNSDLASEYLIDGQQRVTTLNNLWDIDNEYDLYFNPTTEKFESYRKIHFYSFNETRKFKSFKDKLISVKELIHFFPNFKIDREKFWEKQEKERVVRTRVSPGEYFTIQEKEAIVRLKENLNNLELSIVQIEDITATEIYDLFNRINTAGVKLNWVEAIASPLLIEISPFLKNKISEFLDNSEKEFIGFEDIVTIDFFLSSIIRIIEPNYKPNNKDKTLDKDIYTEEKIDRAFELLKVGTLSAVEFLKETMHISTSKTIKKHFSFFMLVCILGLLNNKIKDSQYNTIKLYVLLTNVFDSYSAPDSYKTKKRHFEILRPFIKSKIDKKSEIDEDVLFTNVLNLTNEIKTKYENKDGDNFFSALSLLKNAQYSKGNTSSPFIMLEYYLIEHRAKTFKASNTEIDFSNAHKHHIYPLNYLEKEKMGNIKSINNIGNITYIDGDKNIEFSNNPPIEYFSGYKPTPENLSIHLFGSEEIHNKDYTDYTQLTVQNFESFVTNRVNNMAREFNEYLRKLIK